MSLVRFIATSVILAEIVGAAAAFLVAMALLWLYRRRLVELMSRTATSAPAAGVPRQAAARATVGDTGRIVRSGRLRDVSACTAGVATFALIMTVAAAVAMPDVHLGGFMVLFVVALFPLIPMLAEVTKGGAWAILLGLVLYVAVLCGFAFLLFLRGNNPLAPFLVAFGWTLYPALTTALMFTVRNGRAALLVFGFVNLTLLAPNFGMLLLDWSQILNQPADEATLSDLTLVLAVFCAGVLLLVGAGIGFLVGVRWAYVAKWVSDQTLAMDALLMPFALAGGAIIMFDSLSVGAAAVVVAPVAYCCVVTIVRRATLRHASGRPPKLLFLRVFRGSGDRSLFDRWCAQWRYAGSVRLIAGPDLARRFVEAHDFLDFVTGRLARRFIDSESTCQQALAEEDLVPDVDGRYRMTSFFCRADVWQTVFRSLATTADVIVMDLRGLSAQNEGARFELATVAAEAELRRVVLTVDDRTDHALVNAAFGARRNEVRQVRPSASATLAAIHGAVAAGPATC